MKSPFLKKLLVVAAVTGVVALGVLGALAVVPHAHGHDYNHSSHEACPVHQAALLSVHAVVFAAVVVVFAVLVSFRREHRLSFVRFSPDLFLRLRAPPVS